MLRNRRIWIVLVVLVAVGMGGYFYYDSVVNVAVAEEGEPEVQTAVSRRGDITVSATGAGTVIPAQEIALSFTTGGVLTEMAVAVGDSVTVLL